MSTSVLICATRHNFLSTITYGTKAPSSQSVHSFDMCETGRDAGREASRAVARVRLYIIHVVSHHYSSY